MVKKMFGVNLCAWGNNATAIEVMKDVWHMWNMDWCQFKGVTVPEWLGLFTGGPSVWKPKKRYRESWLSGEFINFTGQPPDITYHLKFYRVKQLHFCVLFFFSFFFYHLWGLVCSASQLVRNMDRNVKELHEFQSYISKTRKNKKINKLIKAKPYKDFFCCLLFWGIAGLV